MNQELEAAIAERDELLKNNPKLQKYQAEIDNILSKCTGQEERINALSILITCKTVELQTELQRLSQLLGGVKNEMQNE
jgi:hypothetical protein